MRLLSQFVIREQEVFSCRVLTYLLHRSPELRDSTIKEINHCLELRAVRLQWEDHFSITREWSTKSSDPDVDGGRLDVLMEIDKAVIGIEAKLNAKLADDQPRKYIKAISTYAGKLAALRGTNVHPVCVVLIPAGRKQETVARIKSIPSHTDIAVCTLSWEDLFSAWRQSRATDPVATFLADELEHLVLTETGTREDFDLLLPKTRMGLTEEDDGGHLEFIGWLYSAFRDSERPVMRVQPTQPRKRSDRTYLGYYFAGNPDGLWGWYGFVAPQYVGDTGSAEPALVMGTDFPVEGLDPSVFAPVHFTHPDFYAGAKWWWRIRFDRRWSNRMDWQNALAPLRVAVENESKARKPAEQSDVMDSPSPT